MSEERRRPAAIGLGPAQESEAAAPRRKPAVLAATPEPQAPDLPPEQAGEAVARRRLKTFSWGKLFWSALGGLVSLALGLWIWSLVEALFLRYEWLGWLGMTLTALALIALVGLILREWLALARLDTLESLRERASDPQALRDAREARAIEREVVRLYSGRPDMARARTALAAHHDAVLDAVDLLSLTERTLLAPLDAKATALVSGAARRVSVVAAVSPRALVDIAFVAFENARTMRRIAALYGGRPGTLALLKLARMTVAHLAVTGGIAMTDSLLQQVLGHGLAARLSARLGEGVLNGFLSARIGLAAIEVCRPLPFRAVRPPRIGDVVGGLAKLGEEAEASR